jgi:hypothetical protein
MGERKISLRAAGSMGIEIALELYDLIPNN